ncbi:hypothetical protein CEUSTIGMA_g39.t1 [Chlamydomonas eustigma]|uniref:acylaminoacyl-peptidase n=1 Tax=Chlamydomonas eustigma TaxID=1157962 RepID=A0A250WP35_9CHLO|nr:hypothetical protein CEUSTIGMA_g39.t1 [Chlamydomonas eustigma]|eukprot:GAX72583.1 hypothetical protein CEUSTIGMA_g39.t1 [Chlamydomonas eustigma]
MLKRSVYYYSKHATIYCCPRLLGTEIVNRHLRLNCQSAGYKTLRRLNSTTGCSTGRCSHHNARYTMETPAPLNVSQDKLPCSELPSGIAEETALLTAFSAIPNINSVHVKQTAAGHQTLHVLLSQRNLPGNSQRKFSVVLNTLDTTTTGASPLPTAAAPFNSSMPLLPAGQSTMTTTIINMSQPMEILADLLLTAPSPSGSSQVVFKSPPSSDSSSSSLAIQYWRGARLVWEILVPKALHGALINDKYFASGAAWCHMEGQEDLVAYTAEVPPQERTPAWGGTEGLKDMAGPKSWRGTGPALEDWGELNTGKQAPGVFVLDLKTQSVIKVPLKDLPVESGSSSSSTDDLSLGQPVWTRDGKGLVVVGWPHRPSNFPAIGKKLGVIFCYNRPAYLYYIPCTRDEVSGTLSFGAAVELTKPHNKSALNPVFTPDGDKLLYISHDVAATTGTHGATAKLCALSWPSALSAHDTPVPKTLVDVVGSPKSVDCFPGLYAASMIDEPFVAGCLVLTSQWRSQTAIIGINLETGQVRALSPVGGEGQASYSLQAISGRKMYATKVAPNYPPALVTAVWSPSMNDGIDQDDGNRQVSQLSACPLPWEVIKELEIGMPEAVSGALKRLEYEVAQITVKDSASYSSYILESVNFYPASRAGPVPTIIAPHGGPHTAMTVGWYMPYAYLASLGYAVLCPNYRGSTGFGQDALSTLPGSIGTNDVQDCMAALQHAVDSGLADPSRVAVVGGSHGGFLTGHLLGQHPEAFKAGVLRNPVCNLSLMVGISDITDWCYVETFGSEEGKRRAKTVPDPEDLAALYAISPIAHIHKVKAPMLFMLGAKDRRVPLADGLQYISALRARAAADPSLQAPRVITFPEDTHSLEKPQTEFEQWLNTAWWLKTYV